MKSWRTMVVLLAEFSLLVPVYSKGKKHGEISAVFANAHFAYVQAVDGDIMKPEVYPEDRDAISNVQQAVRDWNRYAITSDRSQADLVFVVRKGRLVGLQGRGGVSVGTPPYPPAPGPLPPRTSETAGVGAQAGPEDDILRVFTLTPDGKLNGPLWTREMQEGLDAPSVPLVRQLKEAVEAAYPSQPSPPHPKP